MHAVLVFALLAGLSLPEAALAQRAASGSERQQQSAPSSAEERAAQLRGVVARITSPDRELNIANFEEIVRSGDVRMIETAVRTLVSSDDPVMRGLAMRGYLAATRDLVLDVVLPSNELRIVEEAVSKPDGTSNLRAPFRHLYMLSVIKFKINLIFDQLDISSNKAKLKTNRDFSSPRYNPEFTVRGERITFTGILYFAGPERSCNFEMTAAKNLMIHSTVSCDGEEFVRPFRLEAAMF